MSKSIIERHWCDLCLQEVDSDEYSEIGGGLLLNYGKSEKYFTLDGKVLDICSRCCMTIMSASSLKIININLSEIGERFGLNYDKQRNLWVNIVSSEAKE